MAASTTFISHACCPALMPAPLSQCIRLAQLGGRRGHARVHACDGRLPSRCWRHGRMAVIAWLCASPQGRKQGCGYCEGRRQKRFISSRLWTGKPRSERRRVVLTVHASWPVLTFQLCQCFVKPLLPLLLPVHCYATFISIYTSGPQR